MTRWNSSTRVLGLVPGIVRTLIVASADPGITLPRNPALISTGAIVFLSRAWISGSLLTSLSARAIAAASLLVAIVRKWPASGGALVFASVMKNCRVAGVSWTFVS